MATLLDLKTGRWRGMGLPNTIVSLMEEWHPELTRIEAIPGADLIYDSILLRANLYGVATGRVELFKVNSAVAAKPKRIRKLRDLLDVGLLRIRYGSFVEELFHQVENYTFTTANDGREDGALDSLAMLCGFR